MKRIIFASQETEFVAKDSGAGLVKVYGCFPIDRADCPCQATILQFKQKLALANDEMRRVLVEQTPFIECTRSKVGLTRFQIICARCNDVQGYCWASDARLLDWCDFHYVQWTKGTTWHGCFTPHISPVTQQLCLECCCGQDTRDFRANMTLNQKTAMKMEASNVKGRAFNTSNSKFLVKKVAKNVVI